MAVSIPTTQEILEQNVTNFETRLGQSIPLNDKAFYRVLSLIEAGLFTTHYKYAVNRLYQTLALTATGEDLDRIGINYGVTRKAAVSFVGTINQPATAGTSIPVSLEYTSDSSGIRYTVNATVVAGGGGANVNVTAEVGFGADGTLTAGETLTIGRQIAGITSTTASYVSTITAGVDRESDTEYRRRILQEIRTVGGGGNAVDHRTWGEAVTGVYRVFPFSGAPITYTKKLKDGDMELADTTYWSAGNSATLTKNTSSPHGGTYSLKVARSTVNNPYAYQTSLEVGRSYTLAGYAVGDGTALPTIYSGTTAVFTGTTSTSWQTVNVTFTADSTELRFEATTTSGTTFAKFDDFTLTVNDDRPGDRTVYVEVTSAVQADGIPTQAYLDNVRTALNTDPVTLEARMVLGTTDEKLFVEPIVRSSFNVTITNLVVDSSLEAACKASLDTGVDQYFRTVSPYVTGVDSVLDRNDVMTVIKLSEIIQDVLDAYSASADEITFNKVGDPVTTRYTVEENETAKLGAIAYA